MIMPKKKRILVSSIILTVVIFILVIVAGIGLYMTTDLFKSNRKLFEKYVANTFSNVNKLFNDDNMNEMKEILQNNKYEVTSNTGIKFQDDKNENSINNIKLTIDGKIEEKQKYKYQDISLKDKENKNIYRIEYLKDNDKYGIRINGINQFATENISNENQEKDEALLKKILMNSNEENDIGILDFIAEMIFENTKNVLTEEENINLQNKYVGILMKNVTEDKITKKKNVNFIIKNEKINANAYTVTLTKEQLNNIYIEILEELKKDDIIISKMEELEKIKLQYNIEINDQKKENTVKEEFIEEIDKKIKEIQNSNIGNDIRKITVYENKMKSIALQIETNEHTITITTNNNGNNITYEYLKQKTTEKENTINLKIEKISNINDDTINMEYDSVEDGVKTTNYFTKTIKFDKDTAKISTEIARKNQNAEIKINSETEKKVVNEFKDQIKINNENSVDIEKMNQEQKDNINKIMKEKNDKQIEKVFEVISREEINTILEKLELKLEEAEDISDEGFISDTERSRFNSNFEFYEGEKITKDNILDLIDITKNNLEDVRITKYKEQKNSEKDKAPEPEEYKLTIKKNNSNTKLASNLATSIENSKDKEYNVKIEYSQKTGLVESIFITVIK